MAITNQQRDDLARKVVDLQGVDSMFEEVQKKLDRLELDLEDIITVTVNVENQSELIAEETRALCTLVDSLRGYNDNIASMKTKLKEVVSFL